MVTLENYIASFQTNVQVILIKIRTIIKNTAPEAIESISYGMPAYKLNGKPLIYFAGYKKHIGIYATPSGHSQFIAELKNYKQGKGSVQFPLNKPIPYNLIEQIVVFNVKSILK